MKLRQKTPTRLKLKPWRPWPQAPKYHAALGTAETYRAHPRSVYMELFGPRA